ncbi:Uncharacterised protein [uncultured archaeon]|nr:Uncharacterised protein [uncultured archaeon]
MYHPGKVIEVLRASDKDVKASDASTQACVRMWDENILTLLVAPKLVSQLKIGQVVLVDYRPDVDAKQPVPSHTVVKIVEGKKAENLWMAYRDMYDRQKRASSPPAQNYIG